MKSLRWQPQPTELEVVAAVRSAADRLAKLAAKARRLAKDNPGLSEDLTAMANRASQISTALKALRW